MSSQQRRSALVVLVGVVVVALAWWALSSGSTGGTSTSDPSGTVVTTRAAGGAPASNRVDTSGLPHVAVGALPAQARHTLELIAAGGPFPYPRDGVVFQNRERVLPSRPRGYYHEYTVPTPGAGDRGARRIVTGTRGERYWSPDHYATFAVIEGTP